MPTRPHKEQWKNDLQQLKNEYDARIAPAFFQVNGPERGRWEDQTANGITKCVINFLLYKGGHFTRINVMGIPRKNKYGQTFMTPSTTIKGTADIIGVYRGRYVAVEVKAGIDRQSDEQKKVEDLIKKAGGVYIIARSFTGFLESFTEVFS